jgi:PAS domain S-box-containing protein
MFHVLHVEDDRDDALLTQINLRKVAPDIKLEWVVSASEALELIEKSNFDCILSDYQMPSMDGLEFVRTLRAKNIETPFIFLTGQGNENLAAEVLRSGADDYFTKSQGFANYNRLLNSIERLVCSRETRNRLERSEAQFQQLFKSMTSGFALHEMILDDEGTPRDYRFIEVNPAFESMTGLDAGDIIGRTVLEVLPNLEPSWIERYGQVALTGEPLQFESYSQELDKYYMVSAYCPERGYFATTFLDISKRKLAESLIRENEERYRLLFERESDAVFIFDPETYAIIDANATTCRLYGYEREELIGFSVIDLSAEPDKSRAVTRETNNSNTVNVKLRWHKKKDGTVFPIELTNHGMTLSGRHVQFAVIRDIAERHDTEKQLRTTQENMRAMIDACFDAMYMIDTEGNILECNKEVERRFGMSREQILSQNAFELDPFAMPDLREAVEKVISTGAPVRMHYRRGDRTIDSSLYPVFDDEGNVVRIAKYGKDITDSEPTA